MLQKILNPNLNLELISFSDHKNQELFDAITIKNDTKIDEILQEVNGSGFDIDYPNDQGFTALHMASGFGYTKIVEKLLNHGANIDAKSEDGSEYTPLMVAVLRYYDQTVQKLVKRGASVEATDKFGNSAIMLAAMKGNFFAVKLLYSYGADLNDRNDLGYNAQFLAKDNLRFEVEKLIDDLMKDQDENQDYEFSYNNDKSLWSHK